MPTLRKLATFYGRLASMLEAGIPVRTALGRIADSEVGGFSRRIRDVSERLSDGEGLAHAMSFEGGTFPELHVLLVDAGERSGTVPATLKRIVDVIESKLDARRTMIAGMIYPGLVLNGVIFLPPLHHLITSGPFAYLKAILPWLLVVYGSVAGFFVLLMVMQAPGVRLFFDRIFLKIPGVGGFIIQADVSDASMALAAMYEAGVPIIGALERTAQIPRNSVIAAAFARAHERTKAGRSFGEAIADERDLPVLFRDMVISGEASGTLDESLIKVRDVLAEDARHRMKVAAAILPVVFYLLVAAIVGWTVISFFSSYLGALDKI